MTKAHTFNKKQLTKSLKRRISSFWHKNFVNKLLVILVSFIVLIIIIMYAIAQWYIHSVSNQPLQLGVSFIPDYAQSLGLNPEQTMDALLNIGVKQFRLTSYWSDVEPEPNQYNFSQLDWEFAKAQAHHAKIILTLGLRQPRWPECHQPSWVNLSAPESQWEPELLSYISAVVNRYKNSPSLEEYQVENEYFLQGFGDCTNFDRNRLVAEYNLVKKLDPNHPIIIGRSNNTIGIPTGKPRPDIIGISVYQRVWDAGYTHRYIEYPWPAWYYAFLAGIQKIFLGRDMIITEMQAEAWPPDGKSITQISLAEQNKSLNASRLKGRFSFAKATGMRQVEMWGAEYWYYRLKILHDPSLWNVAKQEFSVSPKS